MRTLFVYCSSDDTINSLCRESGFKKDKTKSLQLSSFSEKSPIRRLIDFKREKSIHSGDYGIDINEFDRFILACDEIAGEISPEITRFIKNTDFRYKTVDCIVFGNGRGAKKASDSIKVKVSLSGGTVRSCVNVSPAQLKRDNEDILFSVRHRIAV